VDRNAELKKYEAEKNPAPVTPEGEAPAWVIPDFNANAWEWQTMWMPAQPDIQWGSFWEWQAVATNPDWANQFI
jgi:hypothetical protein